MKINKSILAAIALGLTVGATATACRPLEVEPEDQVILHEHTDECPDECTEGNTNTDPGQNPWDNCPACGMG